MNAPRGDVPVDLDNCAREPIHIPGLVQPHGALVAMDLRGMVTHVSANAPSLLGASAPVPGDTLASWHLDPDPAMHAVLDEVLRLDAQAVEGEISTTDIQVNGRSFDLIVHRSASGVIAEFELRAASRDQVTEFALMAHRAMNKIKRQASIDGLLRLVVSSVRQLTGFDRVMAYRFRHDDSGEVVAEDCVDALEPFLGRRYPASDIPAQARRLYLDNTLRLIADVQATPVAVTAASAALPPLDMSHCVLRSVSPIHIEYLRNMGVGASMSISIVVNGRLWGMLACHHRTAHRVPYSVRMACDVTAQVLAANVQSLLEQARAQTVATQAGVRARLIEAVLHADSAVPALVSMADALAQAFEANAVVIAREALLHVHGDLGAEHGARVVQWLSGQRDTARETVFTAQSTTDLPPDLAAAITPWCGLLALRFDVLANGWLVLLRKEQIETIQWAGRPEKEYTTGPLGPRLTPRGSFDVWKQTVRGTSVPWTEQQLDLAQQLRDELLRAGAARLAEETRARSQLLAMLGHDLRDPLQSISMAASLLEHGGATDMGSRMGQRIQSSSSRMTRLIGQVLDASRLQTNGRLPMALGAVDLVRVLEDLLDESRMAYPGVTITHSMPARLAMQGDADRLAQLFANLIGNARHHGFPGAPVIVNVVQRESDVEVEVRNSAEPIDPELLPHLFSAFRRPSPPNARNKGGLGLGLHIAEAIALGHGGSIQYAYDAPHVVFRVRLPLKAARLNLP